MSRPSRVHRRGATYYVAVRANAGESLFKDDADRATFEKILAEGVALSRAHIHSHCWTDEDIRLSAQVSDSPLSKLMQRLTAQYTRAYNRRHGRSGCLFGGRYDSVLLPSDDDLLLVIRRIHRTPLELRSPVPPAKYAWCSARAYAKSEAPPWLTTERGRTLLSEADPSTLRQITTFLNRVLGTDSSGSRKGDAVFLSWLREYVRERTPEVSGGSHLAAISIEELIAAVGRRLNVQPNEFAEPSRARRLSLARCLVAWHAMRNDIATLGAIAERFQRDSSSLCSGYQYYRPRLRSLFDEPLDRLLSAKVHRGGAYIRKRENVSVSSDPGARGDLNCIVEDQQLGGEVT